MWDKFLDWIAKAYFWIYCKFFQRPPGEPWTRQAARMEERWPAFTWGFALALFGLAAGLSRGWWIILTLAIYLFAWYFLPHIVRYRVAHPDNHPFKGNVLDRAATWAAKRISYNKILENNKGGTLNAYT